MLGIIDGLQLQPHAACHSVLMDMSSLRLKFFEGDDRLPLEYQFMEVGAMCTVRHFCRLCTITANRVLKALLENFYV